MIKKLLKNSRGMSLVEVAVSLAVVSILGVSVMELSQAGSKDNIRLNMSRRALNQRQSIETNLKNPVAWNNMVTLNSSFNCFSDPAGCALNPAAGSGGFYDFVVYDADPLNLKKISFDPTDLKTRISIMTEACPAGLSDPNEFCPLRFQAKWKPICNTYPCRNAQVQINVALNYDNNGKVPFDSHRYDISMIRDFDSSSIQSACLALNGVYNPTTGKCLPKQTNKVCPPTQVLTSVQSDGSITCAPLYSGLCNPTTEVAAGLTATGAVICVPRPPDPASCSVANTDCEGSWGACSATACGTSGTRTYTVTKAASGTGKCLIADGTTDACSAPACTPTNCVGSWSACSPACGPGTQVFNVTTAATNGGFCEAGDKDTRPCNTNCTVPVDCVGVWSSCDNNTGKQIFTIKTFPSGGGKSCETTDGKEKDCDVDCVGSWSECKPIAIGQDNFGSSIAYKEFTITTTKKNNGIECLHTNGETDAAACGGINCVKGGNWSACDPNTGTQSWVSLKDYSGLHDCPEGVVRACSVDCIGSFGSCLGPDATTPEMHRVYKITATAKNGGASCQYADGYIEYDPPVCKQTTCTSVAPVDPPYYWCPLLKESNSPDTIATDTWVVDGQYVCDPLANTWSWQVDPGFTPQVGWAGTPGTGPAWVQCVK